MSNLLRLVSFLTGYLGAAVCTASGLARIAGMFYIAGYQSTTLFSAGVALMVFACMLKLDALLANQ